MKVGRFVTLILRSASFLGSVAWGICEYPFVVRSIRRTGWMQRMSRRFLWSLGGRVEVLGKVPSTGLVVCNHLGYTDIIALGSVCPGVFVAKKDVERWPLMGLLTRMAGTIYVDRERRARVGDGLARIRKALASGTPVVVFPEGTSSDGSSVLPFKTSLMDVTRDALVTPAAIRYRMVEGCVGREIAYWGDMAFVPHVLNLLSRGGFQCTISFGDPVVISVERKAASIELHGRVVRLLDQLADDPGVIPPIDR